jgi:hypothetical protein
LGVIVAVPTAVVIKNILVAMRSSKGMGGGRSLAQSNLETNGESPTQAEETLALYDTPHAEFVEAEEAIAHDAPTLRN